MEQNNNITGQVDLLSFPEAKKLRPGEVVIEEGVFIPRSCNPTIYFCTSAQKRAKDGTVIPAREKAYLDIELHATPENRYGNDYYARPAVGKTNRETLGLTDEEIRAATPIIGNFKIVRRSVQPAAPQQDHPAVRYSAPEPAPEPVPVQSDLPDDFGDMPDFENDEEDIF